MTSTKTNPKPKMEMVAVDELHLDPANARSHDARNIATIKASLARFGQQKPIVVNSDGVVIAGNGTLQAARDLGWEELSVVRSSLDGVDATAYAIADNRTAELGAWDDEVLATTLAALQNDESIDELVTGFGNDEIERLLQQFSVEDGLLPELMSGEKSGMSMTFTLSNEQCETVQSALDRAKGLITSPVDGPINSAALVCITEAFLRG